MGVSMTMPEGHAIFDCGAALDCIGEVAAARTAQAITASGETRRPAVVDKIQRFKFGGVQSGDSKTWIEAFVVPGSTPHLISRRWLSQHRCVVNFDPNNLCLESPEFGSVRLVLHSSGHLLLSRELQNLHWSQAGVILLMILFRLLGDHWTMAGRPPRVVHLS